MAASHVSAVAASQGMQVPPSVPHAIGEGGDTQTPLAQQPLGHEARLQTQVPLRQMVPATQAGLLPQRHDPVAGSQLSAIAGAQAVHAAPATPQASSPRVWQIPPAQHPSGHERASQTQAPSTQLLPAPHAGCPPQVQTPAAEQASARVGSHATHAAAPAPQA